MNNEERKRLAYLLFENAKRRKQRAMADAQKLMWRVNDYNIERNTIMENRGFVNNLSDFYNTETGEACKKRIQNAEIFRYSSLIEKCDASNSMKAVAITRDIKKFGSTAAKRENDEINRKKVSTYRRLIKDLRLQLENQM